ncbi:SEL1-like repeat protein [Henriciella litoralis]|uniref:sel1 repeat family protein n=1 Tax=Henriciella litoralis TaxID=568102 RepID=UPI00111C34C0|nr:sel1 repeat family protein [Henriciella litoralis]
MEDQQRFPDLCERQADSKIVFLSSDELPPSLRDGELYFALNDANEVVAYTYSYLHGVDWLLSPAERDKVKQGRQDRAMLLSAMLTDLYGARQASGHFDQSTRYGFVPFPLALPTCKAWLVEEVAIILCRERTILIDGTEMSLSFIRTDRSRHGNIMRKMIDPGRGRAAAAQFVMDELQRIEDAARLAELAQNEPSKSWDAAKAKWVEEDVFRNCESEDLRPLEEALAVGRLQFKQELSERADDSGEAIFSEIIDPDSKFYEDLDTEDDRPTILAMLELAAERGSHESISELGASQLYCYEGVEQDLEGAREKLQLAADEGVSLAKYSLALMYASGMIASENPDQSGKALLETCAAEGEPACVDLVGWQ